ncbi:hypothetical protein IPM62_05680 [Candidatus Woesebacteria bacterium]|nr:MAG: hypothetical protein IPM62_05680 [Candidatus Woesebacteria bacterium]
MFTKYSTLLRHLPGSGFLVRLHELKSVVTFFVFSGKANLYRRDRTRGITEKRK